MVINTEKMITFHKKNLQASIMEGLNGCTDMWWNEHEVNGSILTK